MLESIPGLPQFLGGTLTGLGHAIGQRLVGLVLKRFTQATTIASANDQFLVRKVNIADLKGSIPDGFRLCRFHGADLLETFTDELPGSVDDGDSLWLIPAGELVLSTEIPMGDATAEADFVVEFDPGEALGRLLAKADRLDREAIGGLVAAGLIAALAIPGIGGVAGILEANRKKLSTFKASLDQSLRSQGIRCKQIREVRSRVKLTTESKDHTDNLSSPPTDTPQVNDKSDEDCLADAINELKGDAEWKALQTGLSETGIPLDGTATQQLSALRDETLKRAISPAQAASRLAALTAEAFERAGVGLPDLARWRNLSQRLNDEGLDDGMEESSPAKSPVGVATVKMPSTWWVWNRAEVDQRRLLYIRRSVVHCLTACNQALATLRDLAALRQLRQLREQLALVRELLDTIPPLIPDKRALRIEGWKIKEVLKSVEQAVSSSDCLITQTRRMLTANPGSNDWQECIHACLQSAHVLAQNINDRRSLR